jgi:hypothetical protein
VCATGERKRRQRANRYRDPLDQLHGTSLPASGESSPGPNGLVLSRSPTPYWGTSALTIGGPPDDPQAALVAYSGCCSSWQVLVLTSRTQ